MDDQEFHTAALVFAHYIGIDLDTEAELIKFAEDALDDLPPDWELGIGEGDNKGIPYFFNTKTDKSVWVHPKESKYRQIVEEERKKLNLRKQQARNKHNDENRDNERDRDDRSSNNKSSKGRNDEMTVIEEFDDEPVTLEKPITITKAATGNNNKNQSTERPKFGMSSDDFFDNEPEEQRDYNRLGSRSESMKQTVNASRGGSPDKKPSVLNNGSEKPSFKPIFSKNWLDDDVAKNDKFKSDKVADKRESPRPRDEGLSAVEKGVSFSNKIENSLDRERDRDHDIRGEKGDDKSRLSSRDNYSSSKPSSYASHGIDDKGRTEIRRSDSRGEYDTDRDRERRSSRGTGDRDRSKDREKSYDREREREQDRERARSSSPSSSRYYEDENRRLKAEIQALSDSLELEKRKAADLAQEKNDSVDRLRRDAHRLDAEVAAKAAEVRRLEEQVDSCDVRARRQADAAVEEAHAKHREAIRLLKVELEDEWRARLDTAKKRSAEEMSDIRREVDETKKRLEDAAEEAEQMRRKVIHSREDGRSEASVALEACRAELRETEEKLRLQTIEMRRIKEDHASLSMKASGAMQSAQVSVAESEAVKAQATSAIAEAHSSQAALMIATQRLHQAEAETSKMRAENAMLKREIDSASQELKKYQAQSFIATEGVTTVEAEARRAKARLQAEVNRLTTRCSELAGLNSALQTEVDMNAETKNQAVREVLQQLSKAEGEQHVAMLRLHDADERHERSMAAIAKSDAELRSTRELLQKKERLIRDLTQAKEEISAVLEDERSRAQIENESNRKEIKELRLKVQEAERNLRADRDKLQEEIATRIPEIAKTAAMEAEKLCQREMEYKLSALRSDYEMKLEQKARDLLRSQTQHEEAIARLKAGNADDKAEVERLRFHNRRLQRRCDELEADADDRRRQSIVATPMTPHYAIYHGTPVVHPTRQHAPYQNSQIFTESIDGAAFPNSGIGSTRQLNSDSFSHWQHQHVNPAQSVDASSIYGNIDEKQFVEMMQNEIKGIQDQLSRSNASAIGATPAHPRWEPHYIGAESMHNKTMSYAATPQLQQQGQYYNDLNFSSAADYEGSKGDRSRNNDSRAWAGLLARQAQSKHAAGKVDGRSVGFRDENGYRAQGYHRSSPDGGLSSSGSEKRKSKSEYTSPRKSGKSSRGSTPVKEARESGGDQYLEPDMGYHPGYWKTKYMR